jgi:hypothetical protein
VIGIEACARRVYELHRDRDVQRGRGRVKIPTRNELDEPTRSRLIAAYWRSASGYGRAEAREVRIS